jgi:predicted glutamine amidotransferase
MCRMFAVIPRHGSLLQSNRLREFRQLSVRGNVRAGASPGHHDGWGVVIWLSGHPTYLAREPTDAATDPKFDQVCAQIDNMKVSSQLIAHLRKASSGSISKQNTHPFVAGQWAFARNGTISKHGLHTKTDSQWFFEELLHRASEEKNITKAIRDQVKAIHDQYKYTSITFLLSDGKDLYAYRDFADYSYYYTMYFTVLDDLIMVSQEEFFDSDWQEVENNQLLHASDSGMDLQYMR